MAVLVFFNRHVVIAIASGGKATGMMRTDIGGPLITSSITNESVDGLGLKVGGSVYVGVKASDVMIGVD
jgi:molybdopterin-binding protein